jgi:mannosyl-oligosaccharide alpha-1,2-mannosidase
MRSSRGVFCRRLGALTAAPVLGAARARRIPSPKRVASEVRDEFLHAWNGYKSFAWGFDEVKPVSGTHADFFVDGHSFGLSMVEALDTLYLMGLDDELAACVAWLRAHLDFDVDGEVEMFEANIRLVAGLLSGYYATGERFMLDGARDLADRLLPAFAKSPSGAPYRFVNLRSGAVRDPKAPLAEIGSNILEFGDLSRLTGDPKYLNASLRAYEVLIAKRSPLDLLGTYFDVERGEFAGSDDAGPNPPSDSFYEYLWGGWQMLGNTRTRDWYRLLTDALLKHAVVRVDGRLWFARIDYLSGERLPNTRTSELAAFYAELLAKGGDRAAGEAYYASWTAVQERYGIIPEAIDYRDLSVVRPTNELRPEYANAAFDLWFLTHDERYRSTAYAYFEALRANCRVAGGYTIIDDVRTRPMKQGDYFPAYAFSENFKYVYLMFADSPRFDAGTYYLNTEGKVLRGLRRG